MTYDFHQTCLSRACRNRDSRRDSSVTDGDFYIQKQRDATVTVELAKNTPRNRDSQRDSTVTDVSFTQQKQSDGPVTVSVTVCHDTLRRISHQHHISPPKGGICVWDAVTVGETAQ